MVLGELKYRPCNAYRQDRNSQASAKNLAPALDELEKIIDEARKAEYGKWDTMFMHIRLMDLWRTRLLLKETIAKIEDQPYTDGYRGFMRGSFWGSAQAYMDQSEGVSRTFTSIPDVDSKCWRAVVCCPK